VTQPYAGPRSPTDAGLPGYLCVRIRRRPDAEVEEPDWFRRAFEALPGPKGTAHCEGDVWGYRAKELAQLLGLSTEAVYAALYDGRLEGVRATGRGWLIHREAVRLWLLEEGTANDPDFGPTAYWARRPAKRDA
jgi:excisionase family DNA binding protein